jgi:hypothetical protein
MHRDVDGPVAVTTMAVMDGVREQLLEDEPQAQDVVVAEARVPARRLRERREGGERVHPGAEAAGADAHVIVTGADGTDEVAGPRDRRVEVTVR